MTAAKHPSKQETRTTDFAIARSKDGGRGSGIVRSMGDDTVSTTVRSKDGGKE